MLIVMAVKTRAKPQAAKFGVIDVKLDVRIDASPAQVWRAIVRDATKWWPRDFYTGANPKAFTFEDKLGGRVYESWSNGGGLVWYDVIGVDPNRSLLMRGQLTARYGGPAMSLLEITLEADGKQTTLHLHDNVFGVIGAKMKDSLVAGWKLLMEDSLKKFVESKG